MRLELDTDAQTLTCHSAEGESKHALYSVAAFEILSDWWVKVGWNLKYSYTFSWMGRPLIQLPEDVIRMQEVITTLQPDYIVETGVAHGGSLVFYATLFEAMGKGNVIGVDIEIRPHNRKAIESHPLFKRIQLIEGSSTDPAIVTEVKSRIPAGSTVLVILDSDHSKAHVAAELECYHDIVTVGSYIVATDGIMSLMHDGPRGNPTWIQDNPTEAAKDFAAQHPEFVVQQPAWPFNESELQKNITHWPGAWIKRLR